MKETLFAIIHNAMCLSSQGAAFLCISQNLYISYDMPKNYTENMAMPQIGTYMLTMKQIDVLRTNEE